MLVGSLVVLSLSIYNLVLISFGFKFCNFYSTSMAEFQIINDKGRSYRQPPTTHQRRRSKRPLPHVNVADAKTIHKNHSNTPNASNDWAHIAQCVKNQLETLDNDDIVKQTWQEILSKKPKTTTKSIAGFEPWPGPIECWLELQIIQSGITFDFGQQILDFLHSMKALGVDLQTYNIPASITQCLHFDQKVPKIPLSMSLYLSSYIIFLSHKVIMHL